MPRLVSDGHVIGGPSLVTDQPPLSAGSGSPPATSFLLLETGTPDNLLLETNDNLLLE